MYILSTDTSTETRKHWNIERGIGIFYYFCYGNNFSHQGNEIEILAYRLVDLDIGYVTSTEQLVICIYEYIYSTNYNENPRENMMSENVEVIIVGMRVREKVVRAKLELERAEEFPREFKRECLCFGFCLMLQSFCEIICIHLHRCLHMQCS